MTIIHNPSYETVLRLLLDAGCEWSEADAIAREMSWEPTAENINALPLNVRKYIYNLETNCDPSGMIRDNFLLRRENSWLQRECAIASSAA